LKGPKDHELINIHIFKKKSATNSDPESSQIHHANGQVIQNSPSHPNIKVKIENQSILGWKLVLCHVDLKSLYLSTILSTTRVLFYSN